VGGAEAAGAAGATAAAAAATSAEAAATALAAGTAATARATSAQGAHAAATPHTARETGATEATRATPATASCGGGAGATGAADPPCAAAGSVTAKPASAADAADAAGYSSRGPLGAGGAFRTDSATAPIARGGCAGGSISTHRGVAAEGDVVEGHVGAADAVAGADDQERAAEPRPAATALRPTAALGGHVVQRQVLERHHTGVDEQAPLRSATVQSLGLRPARTVGSRDGQAVAGREVDLVERPGGQVDLATDVYGDRAYVGRLTVGPSDRGVEVPFIGHPQARDDFRGRRASLRPRRTDEVESGRTV
jgi:hypothetical protein